MINPFKRNTPPQAAFRNSVTLTNSMKALVAQTRCPSCNQLTLTLTRVSQGKIFVTEVYCTNCKCTGESNSTGFQFDKVNSKGKAVS